MEIEIASEQLPAEFDGYRITQLTDIHLGSLSESERQSLKALAELTNKQGADMVVLTGDLVTSRPNEMDGNMEWLEKIKAKDGKYFIYGNHDVGTYNRDLSQQELNQDEQKIKDMMEAAGWIVLRDTAVSVHSGADSIFVANIDEGVRRTYPERATRLIESLPAGAFTLLLAHNPDYWLVADKEVDYPQLTLAGHTHAMQTELSLFDLTWSPSDAIHQYSRGLYTEDDSQLYISKGVGYHIYRRIGTRPEITLLTLKK